MPKSDDMPAHPNTSRGLRLAAWMQMLRPPNLFTVPGDPLAGYFLALAAGAGAAGDIEVWRIVILAIGSLMIYSSGLLQNDYFDLAEDRIQRPSRPLPSGVIKPRIVLITALFLAAAGIAAAAAASFLSGLMAAVLTATVFAYNAGGKRITLSGPFLMGSCRGLSLLMGAAILGWQGLHTPSVLLSALGLTAFIAAVTKIASRETEVVRIGLWRWAPAFIVTIWLGLLATLLPSEWKFQAVQAGLGALAALWMVYCGSRLKGSPSPAVVQKTIGLWISGLLFVQVWLVSEAGHAGIYVAAVLLITWPLSRRVAKWFYAS